MAAATYMYLLWDTANGKIPAGWTDSIECYSKYLRGSDTATSPPTGAGSNTHIHTSSSLSTAGDGASTSGRGLGSTNYSTTNHNHGMTGVFTVGNSSDEPLHRTFQIIFIGVDNTLIAKNIIVLSDGGLTGFSAYTSAQFRYLRGIDSGGSTVNGGLGTHTHSFSGTTNNNTAYQKAGTGISTSCAQGAHNHPVSLTSGTATWGPPRVTTLLKIADDEAKIPVGLIAMFDGDPPANWSIISGSGTNYYQRLLYTNNINVDTTGGAAHGHSVSGQSSGPSASTQTNNAVPGVSLALNNHTHTTTATLDSSDPVPAYVDFVLAKYTGTTPSGKKVLGLKLNERTPRIKRKHIRNKIK